MREHIGNQHGSLASLLVLSENFAIEPNIQFYKECMPVFEKEVKDHWFFSRVFANYQDIKKVSIGSMAPEFKLPDFHGKICKLSSF